MITELADRIPAAVVIVADDGTVLHWNRTAETVFGKEAQAVRGQPLASLVSDRPQPAGAAELDSLTQRQREVLHLIAEGWPTREIAQRLGLSVKTIETHRAHLMQRLKVDSVARLVRYAVSVGLVPAQP